MRLVLRYPSLCLFLLSLELGTRILVTALVSLSLSCLPAVAQSYRASNFKPSKLPNHLDVHEQKAYLQSLRTQRIDGDYCLKFQLIHKPRRANSQYYDGTLYGSFSDKSPMIRFLLETTGQIDSASEASKEVIAEMIIHGGFRPSAWSRKKQSSSFLLMQGIETLNPIVPNILFRTFDLQMPYVYWENYLYVGPDRIGRAGGVQIFNMYPPTESPAVLAGVESVRIALDNSYSALRRASIIMIGETVDSILETRSFSKVQNQWILREVALSNPTTKDCTSFKVCSVALGITLDSSIFNPASTIQLPNFESNYFEDL